MIIDDVAFNCTSLIVSLKNLNLKIDMVIFNNNNNFINYKAVQFEDV